MCNVCCCIQSVADARHAYDSNADATARNIHAAYSTPDSISWVVQLSDLHISKFVHPEIVPDLHAFGAQVLAGM